MMHSNFREEELVRVQGKQYPLVGGRLRLAHELNEQLSISTCPVNLSDERVIVQATVQTMKGSFSGLGNASSKRDKLLSNALVELAETRAIARALRFAGYGVEFTGFEEMPEDVESTENKGSATKAQLEAIAAIARKSNIPAREIQKIMRDVTGKDKSRDMTVADASRLISELNNIIKQSNTGIS